MCFQHVGFWSTNIHWVFFLDDGVLLKSIWKVLSDSIIELKKKSAYGHFLDHYVKFCEEEPLERKSGLLCTAEQCLSHTVSLFLPPEVVSICDFCTVFITVEYKQSQPVYEKMIIALTSAWRLPWILGSFWIKKKHRIHLGRNQSSFILLSDYSSMEYN